MDVTCDVTKRSFFRTIFVLFMIQAIYPLYLLPHLIAQFRRLYKFNLSTVLMQLLNDMLFIIGCCPHKYSGSPQSLFVNIGLFIFDSMRQPMLTQTTLCNASINPAAKFYRSLPTFSINRLGLHLDASSVGTNTHYL